MYDLVPCFVTSLLFPVNESIWEHNKMILMSYIGFLLLLKVFKVEGNRCFSTLISSITCMVLVDVIFGIVYFYILGCNDNFVVTMIIFIFSIVVSQVVGYYLMYRNKNMTYEIYGLWGIGILVCLFAYLTYNPMHLPIFFDYTSNVYGIK